MNAENLCTHPSNFSIGVRQWGHGLDIFLNARLLRYSSLSCFAFSFFTGSSLLESSSNCCSRVAMSTHFIPWKHSKDSPTSDRRDIYTTVSIGYMDTDSYNGLNNIGKQSKGIREDFYSSDIQRMWQIQKCGQHMKNGLAILTTCWIL